MTEKFHFLDDSRLDKVKQVFHSLFQVPYNTRLCGGAAEPYYRPAELAGECHVIEFTRDYLSSALHEVAHWCVAGEERRAQPDYGYWYEPDGRNDEQQHAFELVEVKPQAMERIFSRACGCQFRVSADNLNAQSGPSTGFKDAVHKQTIAYCENGLPQRALSFAQGLSEVFSNPSLAAHMYQREQLD